MKTIALVVFIAAGFLANAMFAASAPSSVANAADMHQSKLQAAMADAGV